MERALIVSATEKSRDMLARLLAGCGVQARAVFASSGAEARRRLLDGAFDLVLVNTPLPDEMGHAFAQDAAHSTLAGVLLLAKAELSAGIAEEVEADGVAVVSRPLSRALFVQALRLVRASRARLVGLQQENRRLQERISDIRLVGRAKCLLIECCGMTEPEAHAYIERQAMDSRRTRRQVAQWIVDGGQPESP